MNSDTQTMSCTRRWIRNSTELAGLPPVLFQRKEQTHKLQTQMFLEAQFRTAKCQKRPQSHPTAEWTDSTRLHMDSYSAHTTTSYQQDNTGSEESGHKVTHSVGLPVQLEMASWPVLMMAAKVQNVRTGTGGPVDCKELCILTGQWLHRHLFLKMNCMSKMRV